MSEKAERRRQREAAVREFNAVAESSVDRTEAYEHLCAEEGAVVRMRAQRQRNEGI